MSSIEVWSKALKSDLNEVSAETTEGGSIRIKGMRLSKVVTVVGSVAVV